MTEVEPGLVQADAVPPPLLTTPSPQAREKSQQMMREMRFGLTVIGVLVAILAVVGYYRYQHETRVAAKLNKEHQPDSARRSAASPADEHLSAPPAEPPTRETASNSSTAAQRTGYETQDHENRASAIPSEATGPVATAQQGATMENQFSGEPVSPESADAPPSGPPLMLLENQAPVQSPPDDQQGPPIPNSQASPAPQSDSQAPDSPSANAAAGQPQAEAFPNFGSPSATEPATDAEQLAAEPGQLPSGVNHEPASLNRQPYDGNSPLPTGSPPLEWENANQSPSAAIAADSTVPGPQPDSPAGESLQPVESSPQPAQPNPGRQTPGETSAGGVYDRQNHTYTVGANENFWVISKRLYGSGAFFKALYEHNRREFPYPNKLRAGDVISAPPAAQLEQTYPGLCPKHTTQQSPKPRNHRPESQRSAEPDRFYIVQDGDTLSNIAHYELGKTSRWPEIVELNRNVLGNDYDYLRPGTQLILPPAGGYENTVAEADSTALRR